MVQWSVKNLLHSQRLRIAAQILLGLAVGGVLVTNFLAASSSARKLSGPAPQFLLEQGRFSFLTSPVAITANVALESPWTDNLEKPYRDPKRHSEYWFKFNMKNDGLQSRDLVMFHNSNYIVEAMSFYRLQNGRPQFLGVTGSDYTYAQRTLSSRFLGARVDLAPGEAAEFMINVKTQRNFHPDFALTTSEQFSKMIQQQNFMIGICVGIHAVAIFMSAIFAYRMRDRAYASFAVLSVVMFLTIVNGFGFRDMLDVRIFDSINSDVAMKLARPATLFFFLHLTSVFLTLHINAPRIDQWIKATMISTLLLAMLSFEPGIGKYALDGGDRLVLIGMILSLVASFRSFRRGVPYSGYFTIAAVILICSTLPLMINLVTGRPFSNFTLIIIPIGQSLEMMVLSMALMAKVRRIDEARVGAEVAANKSEDLKTMLRVMSHDLNNPLTVITSYAQIGIKKADQSGLAEMSKILAKILKAAQNQHDIIEHIKLMRAIEDGKTDLELASVPLLDALKQAESTFEQKLHAKNIQLKYDAQAFNGLSVMAERTSLNHNVLNNLISNAIKFSHPGGVIEITPTTGPDTVKLMIKDHGVGMPEKMAKDIFRTDKPTSRPGTNGETGTGFGMPVVKSYMIRFGGDIQIESKFQGEANDQTTSGASHPPHGDHGTQVTLSFKKAA